MRQHWVIGVLAGLATVAVGATAAAKPLDSGEFHNEFSGVEEGFCDVEGLTVEFHAVVEGRFRVNTKGNDGLVYFAEQTTVENTLTNVENGNSVTEHARVVGKGSQRHRQRGRNADDHPALDGQLDGLRLQWQGDRSQPGPGPFRVRG